MKRLLSILICTMLLLALCVPIFAGVQDTRYRTLTIQDYGHLTDVCVCAQGSEELGLWPGTPVERSGDYYVITLKSSMTNVIISGENAKGERVDSGAILLKDNGKDVTVCFWPNIGAKEFYDDEPADQLAKFFYDLGLKSNYWIISDASWLSSLKADSDQPVMNEVSPGVYRKSFYHVEPGTYSLTVAQGEEYQEAYGEASGNGYQFTVTQTSAVAVEMKVEDGVGVLDVRGPDVLSVSPLSSVIIPFGSGGGAYVDDPYSSSSNMPLALLPLFFFGVVALCVYFIFLLRKRDQYDDFITPEGSVHRRTRVAPKTVVQAVKQTPPEPSGQLDGTLWSSVRKVKESEEPKEQLWRSLRKVMDTPPDF